MNLLRKLRPAKIRSALHRRHFEWALSRLPLDEMETAHLGSEYGGWIVPAGVVERDWMCYCVGAGGDVSFDLALIERYGARVRTFDPDGEFARRALEEAGEEPRFSFHQFAIAKVDGPLRVGYHHGPSRSVSAAGLYESTRFVELPGRTLPSLMAELGDRRVDLLKLDVEGSEYELLPQLGLRALGVKILGVQLHHNGSLRQGREVIAELAEQGYRPVGCRPVVKLTFVHEDALP